MSFSFNDDITNVALSILTPDQAETAQFASTTDDAFIRMYTNNGDSNTPDNLTTGYAIGTSNVDKSSLTGSNNFYIGHITAASNIHRILTIENSNVGINVRDPAPQAALHIAQGTGSNLLLVDHTALVVRQGGYVGIGTTAVVGQSLTVKGTIHADSLVIGDGMSMNSQLITTYGLQPPPGCNQLLFAAADLSNINSLTAPTVRATNYDQVLANIAAFAFLNNAGVSVGTIPISGMVPITTTFKGNSTRYTYTLQIINDQTLAIYATTTSRTTLSSSDIQTVSVTTAGTYRIALFANTYSAGGTGEGSSFTSSNAATFSVASTDTIGAPSVTYSGSGATALQFSGTGASAPVYVSGIPYYTAGTIVTFPASSLAFTNIYNTIDPRTVLTNVLTLRDATNGTNATSFTYASVFSNVLTAANTNTAGTLSLTLNSAATWSTVTLGSTVFNVNYTSGIQNSSLTSPIAYLGSSVNEATMNVATFTGMPIISAYRQAIAAAAAFPLTPTPSTELSTFSSTAVSSHDCFYSPYNNTNTFYSSFNSVPRGTYAPTFASPAGTHSYLCFRLVTNSPLGTFVLNFASSGTSITNVRVYWSNLQPTPAWYDAKVLYFSPGGCAESTYTTATRLPITLPANTTLPAYGDIYVNVEFSGTIPRSGISITNT